MVHFIQQCARIAHHTGIDQETERTVGLLRPGCLAYEVRIQFATPGGQRARGHVRKSTCPVVLPMRGDHGRNAAAPEAFPLFVS